MGVVLFSLPAALFGAVYYKLTLGLGIVEAFSLYVVFGLALMASMTLVTIAATRGSGAFYDRAKQAR